MSTQRDLIARATEALSRVPVEDENHTVAAAAISRSGEIFVGLNVDHFSGGPCAELGFGRCGSWRCAGQGYHYHGGCREETRKGGGRGDRDPV